MWRVGKILGNWFGRNNPNTELYPVIPSCRPQPPQRLADFDLTNHSTRTDVIKELKQKLSKAPDCYGFEGKVRITHKESGVIVTSLVDITDFDAYKLPGGNENYKLGCRNSRGKIVYFFSGDESKDDRTFSKECEGRHLQRVEVLSSSDACQAGAQERIHTVEDDLPTVGVSKMHDLYRFDRKEVFDFSLPESIFQGVDRLDDKLALLKKRFDMSFRGPIALMYDDENGHLKHCLLFATGCSTTSDLYHDDFWGESSHILTLSFNDISGKQYSVIVPEDGNARQAAYYKSDPNQLNFLERVILFHENSPLNEAAHIPNTYTRTTTADDIESKAFESADDTKLSFEITPDMMHSSPKAVGEFLDNRFKGKQVAISKLATSDENRKIPHGLGTFSSCRIDPYGNGENHAVTITVRELDRPFRGFIGPPLENHGFIDTVSSISSNDCHVEFPAEGKV